MNPGPVTGRAVAGSYAGSVLDLQDALNAIWNDPAWKHKIAILPPGAQISPRCSYCRFLADGDRCGNCGAPQ